MVATLVVSAWADVAVAVPVPPPPTVHAATTSSSRTGLEKIKTIGDAYMVAGGHPDAARRSRSRRSLDLALEMRALITQIPAPHGERLDLRIGVDTGPVVAGVIGRRKFSYDLWGDTVNTASRMESHGVAGAIQVTERVADAAGEKFDFEPRRSIEIKGKGPMGTHLLVGRKSLDAQDH